MALATPVLDLETYHKIKDGKMTVEQAIGAQSYPTPLLSQLAGPEPEPTQRKRQNEEDRQLMLFNNLCFDYVADYPELLLPGTDDTLAWFHPPNGGARDAVTGAMLKRMGVRRGIPDIMYLSGVGKYKGFIADMKHGKNKLTDEQELWFAFFRAQGFYCTVAYSAEGMLAELLAYLEGVV